MRLLLPALCALLAGCSAIPAEPVPNRATMTVLYRESPEAVVVALVEAARTLPVLAAVETAVDGFVATERPGGNEGVLTVTAEPAGELTAARLAYDYVPRSRGAWSHVPSALMMEASRRGVHGAAVAQERGYAASDGCPAAEDTFPPSAAVDSVGAGVDERAPVLVGGLTGLAERVRYPGVARRAGIAGTAIARFIVGEAGEVRCAEVVSGLPGGINEEVLRIVEESQFEPGTREGEPVSVRFFLPVTFWLR